MERSEHKFALIPNVAAFQALLRDPEVTLRRETSFGITYVAFCAP